MSIESLALWATNNAELVSMVVAILVATTSNVLYRSRHRLTIKPLYLRIMHGIAGVAIYALVMKLLSRDINPVLSLADLLVVYIISYYTEIMLALVERLLPEVINKLVSTYLEKSKSTSKIDNQDDKLGSEDSENNEIKNES